MSVPQKSKARSSLIHYDYSELKKFLKSIKATVLCGHSGYYGGRGGKLLHELVSGALATSTSMPFKVLEIGMNAGHSTLAFLNAAPHVTVTSVDIGYYEYTSQVSSWLAKCYPDRHLLMLGKSQTVLMEPEVGLDGLYDVAFIDGAHSYKAACIDLRNVRRLLRPGGLLIMDDVGNPAEIAEMAAWHKGPTKAWYKAVNSGEIEELGYDWTMKVAWGRYV
jgi:predicted O-methyltransferase YrrM